MPEKPQKPDKPSQGQTLSLRISDALYARLERAKQLMSSKKGDNVSTSEVAKQLLESAREDRFEVADLLANPTEALLDIRRKGEAQHILSRAEWILLAHFVQKGLEAYTERTPNPVSNESLIGVLDAFLAVYGLRTERTSLRESYYVNNLPSECRPAKTKGDESDRVTSETVRRTVAETRKRLSDPAVKWDTFLAGRNLLILLEDEKLPAADAVNRALRPFFPGLWRLAARGHYCLAQQSLRAKSTSQDSFYQPPIPSIKEGGFTLSFNRGESNDIYLLLSFPGPRGPTYPINGYPKITEFRAMLTALAPDSSTRRWESGHFLGYVAASEEGKGKDYWFRAHENGITFGLSEKDWKSVQALFRRAWELPEIRMAWDALMLEYGEL
ncbi:MAG: hypothetical protein WA639_26075 [Candidatus Acidiferrum sp.]